MSQELGTLVLELRAEVAGFKKSLADAKGSVEQFSGDMRRSNAEASHSLRLLNEEFKLGISRSLSSFLTQLPGVGTAMSLAFAPFAIATTVKVLVDAGEKVYKFAQSLGELSKAEKARHDQVVADAREELQYKEQMLRAQYDVLKAEATTPELKHHFQIQEDMDLVELHGEQIEKLNKDWHDLQEEQERARTAITKSTDLGGAPGHAPGMALSADIHGVQPRTPGREHRQTDGRLAEGHGPSRRGQAIGLCAPERG